MTFAVRIAVQQDHPDVMAVGKMGNRPQGALETRKGPEPAHAKSPTDPEADHIPYEAADPAHRKQGREIERAGRGRVAREQAEQ
jgi:hypothetical protein